MLCVILLLPPDEQFLYVRPSLSKSLQNVLLLLWFPTSSKICAYSTIFDTLYYNQPLILFDKSTELNPSISYILFLILIQSRYRKLLLSLFGQLSLEKRGLLNLLYHVLEILETSLRLLTLPTIHHILLQSWCIRLQIVITIFNFNHTQINTFFIQQSISMRFVAI